MSALSRSFNIPVDEADLIEIKVHEPALTGDNLGLKTWDPSYLLTYRLWQLRHMGKLRRLPQSTETSMLELGAGTGLVGIAAAAILGAGVVLTDLPDIAPKLAKKRRYKCFGH